ncbi:MAG TPA: 6-bladed beta-propeller [Longimicrobiaceae bacterium]
MKLSLALVVLPFLAASPAYAQRTVVVPSAPSCRGCVIRVERVASLGGVADPGHLGEFGSVSVDRRGRYYVTTIASPHELHVFDGAGRYLRKVGRQGDGPGEFRIAAAPVFARGDTMYVLDVVAARVTRLSPSYGVLGTFRVPLGRDPQILVTGQNQLLLHAAIPTADRVGLPLHLLDERGRISRSFGAVRPTVRPDLPFLNVRRVAAGRENRIWSAYLNRYVVEAWDSRGVLHLALERRPGWFAPWLEPGPSPRLAPPRPLVAAIREDAQGRVWVLLHVADQNWRKRALRRVGSEYEITPEDQDHFYDTVIEVLDPRTGRLVASARHPRYVRGFAGDGLLYTYREDADGVPAYEVWRTRLTSPR